MIANKERLKEFYVQKKDTEYIQLNTYNEFNWKNSMLN